MKKLVTLAVGAVAATGMVLASTAPAGAQEVPVDVDATVDGDIALLHLSSALTLNSPVAAVSLAAAEPEASTTDDVDYDIALLFVSITLGGNAAAVDLGG